MGGRAIVILAAAVAVTVLVSASGASTGTGGWVLHVSGSSFSGVFTDVTASPITGIAIGTEDKAQNPITSLTFDGLTCDLYAPYGSAFCETNLDVDPGKSVSYSGTAQNPISGKELQECSSADRGVDNTCVDVTDENGAPLKPSVAADEKEQAQALIQIVNPALQDERNAAAAIAAGNTTGAKTNLQKSTGKLALIDQDSSSSASTDELPFYAGQRIVHDVDAAEKADGEALHDLTKPSAHSEVEDGIKAKEDALVVLRRYTK